MIKYSVIFVEPIMIFEKEPKKKKKKKKKKERDKSESCFNNFNELFLSLNQ